MPYRTSLKPLRAADSDARLIDAMKRASMLGMAETINGAQEEMRDDVLAADLGHKLAKAVRKRVYPSDGRMSMSPAGIVYARPGTPGARSAAAILGHYESGAAITPILGGGLAIPTNNVPRGRRGAKSMPPAEVEAVFGRKLQPVRLESGNIGLYMRMRRGARYKSVLMFVVVKDVPGRKLLDFLAIFKRWGGRLGELIAANFDYRE